MLTAGFWAGLRSGSFAAGPLVVACSAALAAAFDILGVLALLAIWHDPETMAAIRGSGGLEEVFSLPILLVLPGILLGVVGGAGGLFARKLRLA
ncbi:MAG: hypothetical protein M3167_07225 [Acidobacteriota bacterium]|nr:hypothetical protein [Acidobacteriota bacterium]